MPRRFALVSAATLALVAMPSTAFAQLVADWQMNESNGTTMVDSATGVGGANNGTLRNVVRTSGSYRFNGTNAYVSVPNDPALNPGDSNITLTARVQVDNVPMPDDSYDVVRKGLSGTPGGEWKMEIKRSGDPNVGKLHCLFKGVGRTVVKRVAPLDVVDGQWHVLKCVKTNNSVQAIVDGRASSVAGTAGSISNTKEVLVGAKIPGDDHFKGLIDYVTVDITQS